MDAVLRRSLRGLHPGLWSPVIILSGLPQPGWTAWTDQSSETKIPWIWPSTRSCKAWARSSLQSPNRHRAVPLQRALGPEVDLPLKQFQREHSMRQSQQSQSSGELAIERR